MICSQSYWEVVFFFFLKQTPQSSSASYAPCLALVGRDAAEAGTCSGAQAGSSAALKSWGRKGLLQEAPWVLGV